LLVDFSIFLLSHIYIYMYTIIKYIPFTFMARQVIGNSKVSIEENLIL
jgi:hypothetical protein